MRIEYFTVKSGNGDTIEMVNLINEDDSFTQMTKAAWDAQQEAVNE